MRYQRIRIKGACYFFTVVTYQRTPIFMEDRVVEILREAFRYTIQRHPFQINAAVILPEHTHMIWTLPEKDADYSMRWRLIKSYFSHQYKGQIELISDVRKAKGERAVWQRRFWEHWIRDEDDYARHFDYIHYNPVKHGLVMSPGEWKHSSFQEYVKKGVYPADWGGENVDMGEMGEMGELMG